MRGVTQGNDQLLMERNWSNDRAESCLLLFFNLLEREGNICLVRKRSDHGAMSKKKMLSQNCSLIYQNYVCLRNSSITVFSSDKYFRAKFLALYKIELRHLLLSLTFVCMYFSITYCLMAERISHTYQLNETSLLAREKQYCSQTRYIHCLIRCLKFILHARYIIFY